MANVINTIIKNTIIKIADLLGLLEPVKRGIPDYSAKNFVQTVEAVHSNLNNATCYYEVKSIVAFAERSIKSRFTPEWYEHAMTLIRCHAERVEKEIASRERQKNGAKVLQSIDWSVKEHD